MNPKRQWLEYLLRHAQRERPSRTPLADLSNAAADTLDALTVAAKHMDTRPPTDAFADQVHAHVTTARTHAAQTVKRLEAALISLANEDRP